MKINFFNILLVIFCFYRTIYSERDLTTSLRTKKIAQQNLKSFSWEERDWSDDFYEYLNQCLDTLKCGQPFQKRKHVFEVLDKLVTQSGHNSDEYC